MQTLTINPSILLEIIFWYGAITLAMIPIGVIGMIIIEKRTRILSNFLQEMVDKKEEKKDDVDKEKKKETENNSKNQKPEKKKDEERNILKLRTGDTYLCRLNNLEIKETGSDPTWNITDAFVAEINQETGIISAKRDGKTYVECGDKRLYELNVIPSDKEWPLEQLYQSIKNKLRINEIASQMVNKKVSQFLFDDTKRIRKYWNIPGSNLKLHFRYGEKNTKDEGIILQAIAIAPLPEEEKIIKGLKNRMREVPTLKNSITSFWIRDTWNENFEDNLAEFAAFIQRKDAFLIIGFSKLWKDEVTEEEFRMNSNIFLRMFEGMTGSEKIEYVNPVTAHTLKKKRNKSKTKPQTEEIYNDDDNPETEEQDDDPSWDNL